MFENLKGKRLLYLGGIKRAAYVVERAKKLGIYVIVADYNNDSPAKLLADEGILVDATNVDLITSLCIDKHVDGIMTGYADILMPVCYKVAKKLKLPCYYTETMLSAATDKSFFKSLCDKYDVPVPKTFSVNRENYKEQADKLPYPVFVKPLDASGSRGADVCFNSEDFIKKFEYALSFSKKGDVTVEEQLKGTQFILDYLIADGVPYLMSMSDSYASESRGGAVNSPNMMIFPSKYLKTYVDNVNDKVCRMFKDAGFDDGLIFMQGYANDDRIAFFEIGSRLGGTYPYIVESFSGLNPIDALFSHALTGKMLPNKIDVNINPFFNGTAGIIYFIANTPKGYISLTTDIDKVRNHPGVVDVMQFYGAGDHYDIGRQTDVRLLSVHIVACDFKQLKERIDSIYSLVEYYDSDGNSLLSNVYDSNIINNYEERNENENN